ncbi:MAG TPA: response regulator [Sedimentisphaerales bacterium]|nr:response regulator [Sedimentisphaerales bacterium]
MMLVNGPLLVYNQPSVSVQEHYPPKTAVTQGFTRRLAGFFGRAFRMAHESKKQEKLPTVLVVDDNQQNLELIQAYLEDVECQTQAAHDGIEALEMVARSKPDLVLLDVMMPKMSGFEVCRRLKSNPQTSDIPVIMVTALNEFGDIERGIDSGTDDFVSKPINRLELLTRIRTMLKLKHLTDRLQRTVAYLGEIEKQAQIEDTDSSGDD